MTVNYGGFIGLTWFDYGNDKLLGPTDWNWKWWEHPPKKWQQFSLFPTRISQVGGLSWFTVPHFQTHSLAFNFSESQIGDWSTLLRRLVWLERELITDHDNSYDPSACCVLANVRLHFLDIFPMLHNPTVPVATSDHSSTYGIMIQTCEAPFSRLEHHQHEEILRFSS